MVALATTYGSSPHKWGIRDSSLTGSEKEWFIPTQVGNTFSKSSLYLVLAVHPHTSGEYSLTKIEPFSASGSSPHKWGIRPLQCPVRFFLRFIPTQVGNTLVQCNLEGKAAVHPHTSGEYITSYESIVISSGSSPHKWGILTPSYSKVSSPRFIPTQVGNTAERLIKNGTISVHPHTSGEYSTTWWAAYLYYGSSPHKWGILVLLGDDKLPFRFIPTQVGNTFCEI